jgi:hypothetical protein
MEVLLGISPMNLLDKTASPMDIFTDTPDFTPYVAKVPNVSLDNLMPSDKPNAQMQHLMNLTEAQDLRHPDMANPEILNEIIWKSVRGANAEVPSVAKLPAFDLMTIGINKEEDEEENDGD